MKKTWICLIVFVLVFVFTASGCTNNNSSSDLESDNSSNPCCVDVEPPDSPFYGERYVTNYFYKSFSDLIEKIELNGPEEIYNQSPKFFYYTKRVDYEKYEAEFYGFETDYSADYYGFETKYSVDARQYDYYEDYRYKAVAGERRKIVKDFFEQHFYIPKYFGKEVAVEQINADKNVLLTLDETHADYLTVEYLGSFDYSNSVSGEIEENKVFIKFIYTPNFDLWSDLYSGFAGINDCGSSDIVLIHGGQTESVLQRPKEYSVEGETYEFIASCCLLANDDCDGLPVYYIKLDDNTMVEIDFYTNRHDSALPLEDIEPMCSRDMLVDFCNKEGNINFGGFSFTKCEFDG